MVQWVYTSTYGKFNCTFFRMIFDGLFYKHVSMLVINRRVDQGTRVKLTGGTPGHGLSPIRLRDR